MLKTASPTAPASPPFDRYAAWYDAFNPGKDYGAEARYVLGLTAARRPPPRSWLDLGCGTGRHLSILRSLGIEATGVDASVGMLQCGRQLAPEARLVAARADEVRLRTRFAAVSMLFHVMSYVTEDAAIRRTIANVADHLAPDGAFVFDFWHSAAVERDPPAVRVREAAIAGRRLVRIARPLQDRPRRRIAVDYEFRWDGPRGPLAHREHHLLRHFDGDELTRFLGEAGFEVEVCLGWMTAHALSADDWYGVLVARRPDGSRGV